MDQDNQFNAVPEEGVPAPALDAQTVKYLLFCPWYQITSGESSTCGDRSSRS